MASEKVERIAIVAHSFPPLGSGGINISHYHLFQGLKNRGYTVRAFTLGDPYSLPNEEDVERAGLPAGVVKWIHRFFFYAFKILGDRLTTYQFADAVIGSLGGLLVWRRIKRFKPDLVVVPDQGAPSALWLRLAGAKIVIVAHHNPTRFLNEPLFGLHSPRDARLALKLESWALNKAAGVICPSQYMRGVFEETHSFAGSVGVIPYLIDFDILSRAPASDPRAKYGLNLDAPFVYLPSGGSPMKGRVVLYEIVRRLAVGYGASIGFYVSGHINAELARSLSFLPDYAHVLIPGLLPNDENMAIIKACDVCVSPTFVENFGVSLLEAQGCGLPLVTFDVGGNSEIVVNEKTGYVVPFMDVESLVDRSLKLLRDRSLLAQMSQTARRQARERFGSERILDRYVEFFERLA